jgi:hypothetical protein
MLAGWGDMVRWCRERLVEERRSDRGRGDSGHMNRTMPV